MFHLHLSQPDILIPDQCIQIVSGYENLAGFDPVKKLYFPYHGAADKSGVMTVGRGHVVRFFEQTKFSKGITLDQVNQLFRSDLQARARLLKSITGFWHIYQFASALSTFYNIETAWSEGSSVLNYHRRGDFVNAANALLLYCNSNKQPQRGLWRRRGSEALLYLTGEVLIADTLKSEQALFGKLKEQGIHPVWPQFLIN